ncbi:MAG: sodium:alanine symporter family protein [SAR324 cluster bacterium]|nr:sodium:alanine symporter family protein [SAR324 cluster bacterium]
METIASWIWNPLLSLIYIEIGIIVLLITGFAAWRHIIPALPALWKNRHQHSHTIEHERHITPWQAFLTALGAGIGVGNIAGVSTAIHLGGPGALFWMWVSALVGMSFRMCSVWLTQQYQGKDPDNLLYATPMAYLESTMKGLWAWIPAALAGLLLVKGFLTANLIQSNSVAHALQDELGASTLAIAFLLASGVAFVILGGMKKIVDASLVITPWMVTAYLGAGIIVLLSDPFRTVSTLGMVFGHAFSPYSAASGVIGYGVFQTIQFGISRGIFDHGSGMGISPFLHASNQGNPRENAFLAATVPVAETLVVSTITGLVVLSIGNWTQHNGAFLTTSSFESFYGDVGQILIMACLVVFAFTTMINWSYYAERCFQYLGGNNLVKFRWMFIFVTFCGPFFPVKFVWATGDVMIALVIIFHLFPLLYLVIIHRKEIQEDLGIITQEAD